MCVSVRVCVLVYVCGGGGGVGLGSGLREGVLEFSEMGVGLLKMGSGRF